MARDHGRHLLAQGPGPIFSIAFTDADEITDYRGYAACDQPRLAALVDAMQAEGVRASRRGTFFMSAAHDGDVIDQTLAAAAAAIRRLGD